MASQFQDIDLQDIQFLMETAATIEHHGNDAGKRSYYRPDDPEHLFSDVDDGDDPTVVISASIDMQRAFPLINNVLPFEACLYHGILPLYIQGQELYLGMVDLQDNEALTYARKMLGYLKYHLIPQTISSETHHQILSTFLSKQAQQNSIQAIPEHTTASLVIDRESIDPEQLDITQQIEQSEQPTTQPPELGETPTAEIPILHTAADVNTPAVNHQAQTEAVGETLSNKASEDDQPLAGTLHLKPQEVLTNWAVSTPVEPADSPATKAEEVSVKPTFLITDDEAPRNSSANSSPSVGNPTESSSGLLRSENTPSTTASATDSQQPPKFELPGSALPELVLEAPPTGVDWRSLPGGVFLQGLLIRMMASGVGRLFLVRKTAFGQVLWTENGKAKLVLEQVALDQFRMAIDELKQLTGMPLKPVQQAVEIELERFYQRQRILLRLRIAPKEGGEEATIQVLRGAALKFYQKHQVNNLRRDTQDIAQQLRHKVLELGKRSHVASEVDRSTLPEIDRTIASLESQLIELKKLRYSLKGERLEDKSNSEN